MHTILNIQISGIYNMYMNNFTVYFMRLMLDLSDAEIFEITKVKRKTNKCTLFERISRIQSVELQVSAEYNF